MRYLFLSITIVALAALVPACGGDPPTGPVGGGGTGSGEWTIWSAGGFAGTLAPLSSAEVIFVGLRNDIFRARAGAGAGLSAMDKPATPYLAGLWAASDTDIFAVGGSGTILHYDGKTWNAMTSGTSVTLNAVHGVSSNRVYAAGDNGTVLHYDGQQWAPVDANTTESLASVWVWPNEVFAGTRNSSVIHYAAGAWLETTLPNLNTVEALWGAGENAMFALKNDDVFFYDGNNWNVVFHGNGEWNHMWGRSRSDVYIAGTDFQRYNGVSWAPVAAAPAGVRNISASSDGTLWALTLGNGVYRNAGAGWQEVSQGFDSTIRDIVGFAPASVFAVAGPKAIRFDGSKWRVIGEAENFGSFRSLWGAAPNDLWFAATEQSKAPMYYWNGQTLAKVTEFSGQVPQDLWGTAGNDIMTVGQNGFIARYDGSSWQQAASGTSEHLYGIWGAASNDYWAAGWNGTVLHYNGTSWSLDTDLPETLWAVWGAGGKVIAVGATGAVYVYDGQWNAEDVGTSESLSAVWGTGADDVFVCGARGFVTRWDGSQWRRQDMPTQTYFTSGWSVSPSRVWLGGEFGALYLYD